MQLKRAGANYSACCPFHSEKTPSFTVSQTKQFYHCFGCGAHGTAIGFLMEYQGMGFVDAVKDLAETRRHAGAGASAGSAAQAKGRGGRRSDRRPAEGRAVLQGAAEERPQRRSPT